MTECRRLIGKTAVITGASQGLGEALAHRLGKEGANVAIADIADKAASKVAADVAEAYGVGTIAVHCDVTNEQDTQDLMQRALDAFGSVDIVVSNAGVLFAGEIDDLPAARWKLVIDVNLIGYYMIARAAAHVMKNQGSGVIIQINSKSGKKGSYKNSAYAASKFGGIGLTQSLGLELAENNIRVNSICPGNLLDSPLWVNSLYKQYAEKWGITEEEVRQKYLNQVPMKRGCRYEDVANVMVFLASEESSYMTGQAINVTGGQEMH